MKAFCASIAVISFIMVAGVATAAQQGAAESGSAPTLVRIDGQLKTPTGEPRTGSVSLAVSLYEQKDDTTPLWVEQQVVTLDSNGRYTVFAGATLPDGVPQEFFSGSSSGRWLGVGEQGEAEQFRMMLVTVPYAAKAREAATLAGKSATDFVLSENLGDTVKAALKADLSKASSASGDGPGAFGTTNVIQKGAGGAAVQDATGFVEVGGYVGIGTGTPQHTLHVLQTSPTGNAMNVNRNLPAASTDSPVMYIRQQNAGDDQPTILIDSFGSGAAIGVLNGNVGVGTATPLAALDINRSSTGSTAISVANPTPGTGNYSRLDIKTNAGGGRGLFDAYSSTFTSSGNSVQSGVSFTAIGAGGFSIALADATAPMRFYTGPAPTEYMRITSGGNVGIGTTAPTQKLDVQGNINVSGNINAKYQDVAEWVETSAPIEAGTVVIVDPLNPNRVLTAPGAYDTRVAGAVSKQPGLILGERSDTKAMVAQSGRVRIKADAKYGAIKIGDLLVTSPTPGYAMRSQPIKVAGQTMHRPGTLLGKALEALPNGQGEILVLLTLQ